MDSVLGCRSGHSTEVRLVVSPGPTEWGIHWGKRIRGKTWGKTWVIPTRSKPQRRLRGLVFESDSVGVLSIARAELFCDVCHCINVLYMRGDVNKFITPIPCICMYVDAYASIPRYLTPLQGMSIRPCCEGVTMELQVCPSQCARRYPAALHIGRCGVCVHTLSPGASQCHSRASHTPVIHIPPSRDPVLYFSLRQK